MHASTCATASAAERDRSLSGASSQESIHATTGETLVPADDKVVKTLSNFLADHKLETRERLKSQGILKEEGESNFSAAFANISNLNSMLETRSWEGRERLKTEGKLSEEINTPAITLAQSDTETLEAMDRDCMHTKERLVTEECHA